MLYPSLSENPAKTVLFKIVIPIVLSFIAGAGLMYIAFFSKSSLLQSSISNEESQPAAEEIVLEDEQPLTIVYTNDIYGISFLYPSETYSDFKENKFSEFGDELGSAVPYEEIILAKDGNVSIAIWNISKLPEFKKNNPGMQLIDQASFSMKELESLSTTQNQYYFVYNKFFIYISIDATRVKQSQLGELFVKSFRTFSQSQTPNTEFWKILPTKDFSVKFPLDWSAKSEDETVRIYSVNEGEKTEGNIPGYGLVSYEVISLVYTDQSLDSWVVDHIDSNREYVKKHISIPVGENTLHTYTSCNLGGLYDRGRVLDKDDICSDFSAITSTSDKVISVIGRDNKTKVDPYVDVVLGTIVFN